MTSAYAQAGVDIAAGERAVDLMKTHVARASRPEVLGGLGGFAGCFDASALKSYRHPVLASSTDGVGTKVAIAQALGRYDSIGFDLVGMLVDDLVVVGAEPLFVTDYIACGRVIPERIATIVAGVAAACAEAGAALIGGETAEHPGLLSPDEFDLAGATTGVVERDQILGPERVRPGDLALALASSGLHANGYSLVRRVLAGSQLELDDDVPEFGHSLGQELLTPTRIYAKPVLATLASAEIHAMAHITGGGLANNLARVIPPGCNAVIDRSTWQPAPIFGFIQRLGQIDQADLEATFNLGAGFVLILPESALDQAQRSLAQWSVESWVCGRVEPSQGHHGATVVGRHPVG